MRGSWAAPPLQPKAGAPGEWPAVGRRGGSPDECSAVPIHKAGGLSHSSGRPGLIGQATAVAAKAIRCGLRTYKDREECPRTIALQYLDASKDACV
jgi:hypothetical protein